MLRGEHFAGAADAGLDFVEYQQNTVPIAQFSQSGKKSVRRHEIAALPLNRLHQDRGDFPGRYIVDEQHLLDVVEHRPSLIRACKQRSIVIGIRDVGDAGHRRKKASLLACTC